MRISGYAVEVRHKRGNRCTKKLINSSQRYKRDDTNDVVNNTGFDVVIR